MRVAGKVTISISVGTLKIGDSGIFSVSTAVLYISWFMKYFLVYPLFRFPGSHSLPIFTGTFPFFLIL